MTGTIILIGAIAFTIGGMFGFVICAMLVASKDERRKK